LIAIEKSSLSFLDWHFIFDYLKPLMHIVWSPSCLQPFLLDPTKSYLSSSISSPILLESRGEIPFKGGSLSHPKNSILECERFFQMKFKISKGFYLFSFKIILFEFIFSLKWVCKVEMFIWCSKFHLKWFIHLSCEIFQIKSIVIKSLFKRIFFCQPSFKMVYKSL
jgi:hypothetical protein